MKHGPGKKASADTHRLARLLKRAIQSFQAGQLAQAEAFCVAILSEQANQFDALHMLGVL